MKRTVRAYVTDYNDAAKKLGVNIESLEQQITKTAEAAWAVDSFSLEPDDEPPEKSPPRRAK